MSTPDWIVLFITLICLIAYGLHKGRKQSGAASFLLAERQLPWYIVLLGVMSTQASAITFLSAPGQAYTDGMRFVQYYFGLPIAMLVISVTFIPIFRKMNVYTAYEYLEQRFDKKTRLLTSLLFLLSRGLSTGISIYAPAIIISSILGLNIYLANIITGGLLLVYTYFGGAKAIAHTQKLQFLIILLAMGTAGYMVIQNLPEGVGFSDALYIAGKSGKLNVITTDFSWKDKYNIWSGIIGGFFLALSYFGTDHSQVGRYITAKDNSESKLGLLLNGIVKIPMQFLILLIGTLLFALYSFTPSPISFNSKAIERYKISDKKEVTQIQERFQLLNTKHIEETKTLIKLKNDNISQTNSSYLALANYLHTQEAIKCLRDSVAYKIEKGRFSPDKNDTNYIFLYFVKNNLPIGLIGLIFATIILASWGSISASLNALTASSVMDLHIGSKNKYTQAQELKLCRLHTLGWGLFCIGVAMFAAKLGSLIEAVNILGSLFYGTILGIFLVAFYMKKAKGTLVFSAAIITEILVVAIFSCDVVSFLWLNVIGTLLMLCICSTTYLRTHKH